MIGIQYNITIKSVSIPQFVSLSFFQIQFLLFVFEFLYFHHTNILHKTLLTAKHKVAVKLSIKQSNIFIAQWNSVLNTIKL